MIKKIIVSLSTILITISVFSQQANKCNYTINGYKYKFDGKNINDYLPHVIIHDADSQAIIDSGEKLSLKEGDVICMKGTVDYQNLKFDSIIGTKEKPIIIKNIDGQVKIKNTVATYGWQFRGSKNFKLLGNGDPNYKYGFKITTHHNSYLQMVNKTTDFEIANVEIAGDTLAHALANQNSSKPVNLLGFAGIMAKSQPICWDDKDGGSTDAGNFEMKNVSIHDNYIHDVSGEGMYFGYGRVLGVLLDSRDRSYMHNGELVKVKCTRLNYPHNISNLNIYNNIVDQVGWDGIQVKNAHENTNVYNNIIKNYAKLEEGNHDEGLFVGDGSEANIYGNWIENGTKQSNGIQINAFGNTKIYNNVVLGAGYTGLYINNRKYAQKPGVIEVYNNTLEGGTGNVITAYVDNQDVNVKNNIGFHYGIDDPDDDKHPTKSIKIVASGTVSSNLIEKEASDIAFTNFENTNLTLSVNSPAINAGESYILNKKDFTGALRTDGSIDLGAFEFEATFDKESLNILINTPSDSIINATNTTDINIKATLLDPNNKVKKIEYLLNDVLIGEDIRSQELEYNIDALKLNMGENIFKIKALLLGGVTYFSEPLLLNINDDSINNNDNKLFDYYYNSSTDELIINKPNDINVAYIEVYNMLGKIIYKWDDINNNDKIIRKKNKFLLQGVFIIKIKTSKGITSKKIFFSKN